MISVQRYDRVKGQFETAGFRGIDEVLGIDFQIIPGEGYFINMKNSVSDIILE